MKNQEVETPKMDIWENINTVRTLTTQQKPDELNEPIDALMGYAYENISVLNEDKTLKQQIADGLLLAGKQKLVMLPQKYNSYLWLAFAGFLNDDIYDLCQNMIMFFEADKTNGGEPLNNDECVCYFLFFYNNLTDTAQQVFYDSMTGVFEKLYPNTAATYYIKSLDVKMTDEEILDYLIKTIAVDKDFTSALYDIAVYYQFNKNWKNAVSYFKRCVDLGISDAEIFFNLAWCYGKIKDYNNEMVSYKNCLDIDPQYQFAMNNLGYAYEKSKDYDHALLCYQEAIKTDDHEFYPYRNTYRLLKKLKKYGDAVSFWDANKSIFPASFQNEVDKLRNEKISDEPLQVIADDTENDIEAVAEVQTQKKSARSTGAFLAESRLEDEIEAQLDRGIPFCNLSLKMYDESDGYGRQYIIPGIGRIDLLTVNTSNNDLYVIELKKGHGDDEIVGQVSRYMGWVKENLMTDGQNVYGIICTAQASDKLKYAAAAHPNISVFNYSLNISLA